MRRNIMLLKVKSFLKGPTKRNQFALHSNERNTLQNSYTRTTIHDLSKGHVYSRQSLKKLEPFKKIGCKVRKD